MWAAVASAVFAAAALQVLDEKCPDLRHAGCFIESARRHDMRRIITLAALSLSLFGGVAMAGNRDGRMDRDRDHDRVEHRETFRDRDARHAPRFERHEGRRGRYERR